MEAEAMPDVPMPSGGDGWESWIIGTFASMLATMITTIVTMVRFIQGQYVKQIADLNARIEHNETQICTLSDQSAKCFEDRATLRGRVEALEKKVP